MQQKRRIRQIKPTNIYSKDNGTLNDKFCFGFAVQSQLVFQTLLMFYWIKVVQSMISVDIKSIFFYDWYRWESSQVCSFLASRAQANIRVFCALRSYVHVKNKYYQVITFTKEQQLKWWRNIGMSFSSCMNKAVVYFCFEVALY